MYEEYGITQEQYENILNEYGDVNLTTIQQYFERVSIELSNTIKDKVYENKKEKTKFMDNTKLMFFTGLVLGFSYVYFKNKLEDSYELYQADIDEQEAEGYNLITELIGKAPYQEINDELEELLDRFKLDRTSTKTADDKYIKVIENYYKKMEKSTKYFKETDTLQEYLSKHVDKFDKLEKTVAYYKKDGTISAYFDIASYDSMVYNTNLTRTGVRESIRHCLFYEQDVIYVDAHPFACPECQIWQGKFYSLSGKTTDFYGEKVLPFDMALEGESGIGLLHPNCTHVPRPAYITDRLSSEYSSPEWEEKYNTKQKIQALELKKSRLRNDKEIYRELDDQASIDEINQKIRSINEKIKELSK